LVRKVNFAPLSLVWLEQVLFGWMFYVMAWSIKTSFNVNWVIVRIICIPAECIDFLHYTISAEERKFSLEVYLINEYTYFSFELV
jgi:hypothetical protein